MPKQLFPFRYRDERTGKWVRARYVAERQEIAARYKEWEITGPPEIRSGGEYVAGMFAPYWSIANQVLPGFAVCFARS